jgi:branched-chain amino acid transport system ATP-binding protein
MTLLRVENLRKSFGAVTVADNMSWSLEPGEALGVIGPNGAGKSSMFNLIGGDIKPDAGKVIFDGKDISALPPFRRCRAGIGRTYQIPQPFGKMSVFENLLVPASFAGGSKESATYDRCAEILAETGLLAKANQTAGSLTLLDRKRLELARAMAANPRLLLLDEIAGGLTEPEAKVLVETIQKIHASGTAIVWIEHVVHALLQVASKLIVINFGAKVMEGEPTEVMNSAEVKRIYMGIEGH